MNAHTETDSIEQELAIIKLAALTLYDHASQVPMGQAVTIATAPVLSERAASASQAMAAARASDGTDSAIIVQARDAVGVEQWGILSLDPSARAQLATILGEPSLLAWTQRETDLIAYLRSAVNEGYTSRMLRILRGNDAATFKISKSTYACFDKMKTIAPQYDAANRAFLELACERINFVLFQGRLAETAHAIYNDICHHIYTWQPSPRRGPDPGEGQAVHRLGRAQGGPHAP